MIDGMEMTIRLSPKALASIIVDYLRDEERYDAKVEDVEFIVDTVYEGYGPGEIEVKKFAGCTIEVKPVVI